MKGFFIPLEFGKLKLTQIEEKLLATYRYYTIKGDYHHCTLTNKKLAEMLYVNERSIKRAKKKLKELGYIKTNGGIRVWYVGIGVEETETVDEVDEQVEEKVEEKVEKKGKKAAKKVEEKVEDESETEVNEYEGKSAQELFKLCKKRGLDVPAKKNAKYYVEKLVADDSSVDDVDDEDDWGEEEVAKIEKKVKKPAKKDEKKIKKPEPESEPDDDDEDWDI